MSALQQYVAGAFPGFLSQVLYLMKNMRWVGVGVLVVMVAACGKQAAEPAAAIPVLVVHPDHAWTDRAAAAYPGEVRARQESPLSFRVGGNLVKRLVDAGERVKKGQLLAELDAADYASQAGGVAGAAGGGGSGPGARPR